MDKLQEVLDLKVEDLVIFSDRGLELIKELSNISPDKKESELTESELEIIFNVKLINNVITNKIISILELKYLSKDLGLELNFDKFFEVPNVVDFETTYKKFKEDQKFYNIIDGEVKRDLKLTEPYFEKFIQEIKNVEGN